jgi:hypothetical protein
MKTYIGISRDHSGSMSSITRAAARDYNKTIVSIRENSEKNAQDTIVSVVKCGVRSQGLVEREVVNSSVASLKPLDESTGYKADGGSTPLFDSVGELIEMFERLPDAQDKTVSFVIMAVTDGGDNNSPKWRHRIADKIQELQRTDRWSFIFRVPRGNAYSLTRMGIPAGNILEWDQTDRGVEVASAATENAFETFYMARARGETSTKGFYATNAANISTSSVKARLLDITNEVKFYDVSKKDAGSQIRAFVERQTGKPMGRGTSFYQLMKTESKVQDHKVIVIRNKKSKTVHTGAEARAMLGLPYNGTVKVVPGNHGLYDIFIQSTSVNRKLVENTQVMYWENAGTAYQS